ncbi:MurR/RpiR family transcriptional regulator [[Mycoplasma] collis]|uniref:MurR/RpiR family transcriptional regulator n=1 Tax=[Mycoplasma] collis TaxID=2127 RepID=UPI00051C1A24|nr:MurR/RpiR family transcriptional regulator [[Mycoplasma] collis]
MEKNSEKYNIIITLNKFANQNINLTYKNIASVFLQNIRNIKSLPIKTVSKQAHCSQSSISFFVKKIGFNNYKELLFELDLSSKFFSFNKQETNELTDENKILNYYKKIISNINFAFLQNKQHLIKIVDLIKKSKRIFIFGKGSNIEPIIIFSNYLIKNNFNTFYSYDLDVQKKWTEILKKDDVCIFLSFSGLTKEIIDIFNKIKNKKIKTVIFSSNFDSPLIKNSDYYLLIKENEDVFEKHTNARISYIFLIMQIMNLLKN